MKQLLCALCAALIIAPMSFACDGDHGKCEPPKKNESSLAACDKCKKGDCDKDKKAEGTLAACDKCKKGDCDKDKKAEGTLV